MWALLVAAKSVIAEKESMDMIEDILRLTIAVALRSRRRVIVEDGIEDFYIWLVGLVGIDVKSEERNDRRACEGMIYMRPAL